MKLSRNAFTLIEMLLVIAIISILAAMAISSFSNAAQDSRQVVVRQQLAVFQESLNNWASREVGRVTSSSGGNPVTIAQLRTDYNAATTVTARLNLFKTYLDDNTARVASDSLVVDNTTGRLTTDAMRQTGNYLTLPDWGTGDYPKVRINP